MSFQQQRDPVFRFSGNNGNGDGRMEEGFGRGGNGFNNNNGDYGQRRGRGRGGYRGGRGSAPSRGSRGGRGRIGGGGGYSYPRGRKEYGAEPISNAFAGPDNANNHHNQQINRNNYSRGQSGYHRSSDAQRPVIVERGGVVLAAAERNIRKFDSFTADSELLKLLLGLNYNNCEVLDRLLLTVVEYILRQWDMRRNDLMHTLIITIAEFPNNVAIYALLVALLSEKSQLIAKEFLEFSQASFELHLVKGNWQSVKVLLRFLAELANLKVLDSNDVRDVFFAFINVLPNEFARQERKDTLVECVLKALLTAGGVLDAEGEFSSLFETIGVYMNESRSDRKLASQHCRLFPGNKELHQPDALELLCSQVLICRSQNWKNYAFTRPAKDVLGPEFPLTTFPFGPIQLPSDNNAANIEYPAPFSCCEIFHPSIISARGRVVVKVPELMTAEHAYIYDVVQDVVDVFSTNRRELVRFITENITFPVSSDTININHVIMDVLISSIFRLPSARNPSVYYQVAIMEMCRAETFMKVVPPILGKAFYTLFEQLDQMDVQARHLFCDWFSFHIANFEFKWNWKEWLAVIGEDFSSCKAQFLREVLSKCIRLAYYDKIVEVIPAELDIKPFLPPLPEARFEFTPESNEDSEQVRLAENMNELLLSKQSLGQKHDLISHMKALCKSQLAGESLARNIVFQCVLSIGRKSYSHLMNAVERDLQLLTDLVEDDSAKIEAISICDRFWRTNPQMFAIAIEILCSYKIISVPSIIAWIFAKDGGIDRLSQYYLWDLLCSSVDKISVQIQSISSKLDKDPSDMNTAESSDMDPVMLRESLNELKSEQKRVFTSVFENLVQLFQNTQENAEVGELIKIFTRRFHSEIKGISKTLEMVVFTKDVSRAKGIFKELQGIHL